MEYASGGTLAEYLARQRGHLPEQEVRVGVYLESNQLK